MDNPNCTLCITSDSHISMVFCTPVLLEQFARSCEFDMESRTTKFASQTRVSWLYFWNWVSFARVFRWRGLWRLWLNRQSFHAKGVIISGDADFAYGFLYFIGRKETWLATCAIKKNRSQLPSWRMQQKIRTCAHGWRRVVIESWWCTTREFFLVLEIWSDPKTLYQCEIVFCGL